MRWELKAPEFQSKGRGAQHHVCVWGLSQPSPVGRRPTRTTPMARQAGQGCRSLYREPTPGQTAFPEAGLGASGWTGLNPGTGPGL